METILLAKTNEDLWNNFCLGSDDAWFWHTADWMDYVINYKPEHKPRQLSFFVKEDNKCVAICPLILEEHNGIKEFSFSGFGMPVPALLNGLSYRLRKKTQDFIFEYIDHQAKSIGVQKASFRFSPLAPGFIEMKLPPSNYLLKYGYLDATFNTQILDISFPIEELKSNMRKGHRYNVNNMSCILDINIFDANSITRQAYDLYCELHHKDAGRITRPQITFDLMFDWIRQDKAVLLGAKLKEKNQFVGFAYFMKYKNGAYYGSACSDPGLLELYITHYILWETIKWLKSKKIRYFEIGQQFYGSTLHYSASEKECTISKFKRGFGGEQIPQIISEKYYDKEYMKKDLENNLQQLIKAWKN